MNINSLIKELEFRSNEIIELEQRLKIAKEYREQAKTNLLRIIQLAGLTKSDLASVGLYLENCSGMTIIDCHIQS